MKLRLIISVLIVLVGFGCYRKEPPKKGPGAQCPSGQTVWQCDVKTHCSCTGGTGLMPDIRYCAKDQLHFEAQVTPLLTQMFPNFDMLQFTNCSNTGATDAPLAADTDEELVSSPERMPQAWGDAACSKCVASACKAEAWACYNEVTVCRCLDHCQLGATVENHIMDLNECGCAAADSPTYEAFRACAAASCVNECFPQICDCP